MQCEKMVTNDRDKNIFLVKGISENFFKRNSEIRYSSDADVAHVILSANLGSGLFRATPIRSGRNLIGRFRECPLRT
jgi:hypothetical protein